MIITCYIVINVYIIKTLKDLLAADHIKIEKLKSTFV
jgi:hypothetical protein